MIIDLILDRRENDALQAQGYTHVKNGLTGELIPLAYDAARFYRDVMSYGSVGHAITRAMDFGDEWDVRRELKDYILRNDYNPEICDYISSVSWLQ